MQLLTNSLRSSLLFAFSTILLYFVLGKDDGQLRVLLPPAWSDNNGNVYRANRLIEDGVLTAGETVTVKALKTTVKVNNDLSISILLSYDIIQGETHIHGVLPFNIETSG